MQAEEFLVACPFPDLSNPHAARAANYVAEVAADLGLHSKAAAEVISGIAIAEAAALTYPAAAPERLQVAALWFAFLVLFDDAWSDNLELGPDWRATLANKHQQVHRVLERVSTGGDDPLLRLLNRIVADIETIDPAWDTSLLCQEIRRYLAATFWEVEHRSRAKTPDLMSYINMRRVFSTMTVQLELNMFVCQLGLPSPLRDHPCVRLVDAAVADYGCIVNDLYSLDRERADGVTSNVVMVLQHEYGWDEQSAVSHAVRLCDAALATYHSIAGAPEVFGLPADEELQRYFVHYEAFMSAAVRWPARSARYRARAMH